MKRTFFAVILSFICIFGFSQEASDSFFDKPFYKVKENDYVLYLDQRNDSVKLIGIQYLDDQHYRLREFDYEKKENTLVKVRVEITEESISVNDYEFIEGEFSLEKIQKISELFITLLNNSDRIDKSLYPSDPGIKQKYERDGIKYEQDVKYKFWVPLFQMHGIEQTEPEGGGVTLIALGIPSASESDYFESFTYYPNEIPADETVIEPAEEKILKYGDIEVIVDENWVFDEGNIIKLPINTEHDAAISLNNFEHNNSLSYPDLHMAYLRLTSIGGFVPAQSVSITRYDDCTVSSYEIYDESLQRYTLCHEMYFDIDGRIYLVSVNAFKDLFYNNMDYFNTILQGIKIIQ